MPHLLTQQKEGIVTLTLNRPEVHNALNVDLIKALTQSLQDIARDDAIQVVCLAGSGKHFCAGGDLAWLQAFVNASVEENIQNAQYLSDLFHTLYSLGKPTIAIIQGAAYGGGLGLIACCDIVIASEKAQFSFSEVKLGLVPAIISPYILKAIGERYAKRYFLTAEIFDASQALQMGLIHEKISEENLLEKVQEITNCLLKNSTSAMKTVKQKLLPSSDAMSHQEMIKILADICTSKEAQARLQKFLKGKSR